MKKIQTVGIASGVPFPDPSVWFDYTDERTHIIREDGSRWAECQAGSGRISGPLSLDRAGIWCFVSEGSEGQTFIF